jgi:hypothetical protein
MSDISFFLLKVSPPLFLLAYVVYLVYVRRHPRMLDKILGKYKNDPKAYAMYKKIHSTTFLTAWVLILLSSITGWIRHAYKDAHSIPIPVLLIELVGTFIIPLVALYLLVKLYRSK